MKIIDQEHLCEVEFQGSLVTLKVLSPTRPEKKSDGRREYEQEFARAFDQRARELLSPEDWIEVDGLIVAADLPKEEIAKLQAKAWEAAQKRLKSGASKRGRITEFSRASRLRLLKLVARLRSDVTGLFITLTYRQNMTDHVTAKGHLDLMLRWIKARLPGSALLWRMEYQRRGAIHFHIIAFGAPYLDVTTLTQHWQKVTGDDSYPDVKKLNGRRQVLSYVSKYLAKVGDDPPDAPAPERDERFSEDAAAQGAVGLDNEPYSEIAGNAETEQAQSQAETQRFVGRYWGVVNRALLPFAEKHRRAGIVMGVYVYFKRAARRFYEGLERRKRSLGGFSLFVNDLDGWLRLWDQGVQEYYGSWQPDGW